MRSAFLHLIHCPIPRYHPYTHKMHFQQAVPHEIRSLPSRLEHLPPTEQQNLWPRPPAVTHLLLALLALPTVHVLGESWGLRPVPATCFSFGTVLSCALVAMYILRSQSYLVVL